MQCYRITVFLGSLNFQSWKIDVFIHYNFDCCHEDPTAYLLLHNKTVNNAISDGSLLAFASLYKGFPKHSTQNFGLLSQKQSLTDFLNENEIFL